jgi:hypothetical protein
VDMRLNGLPAKYFWESESIKYDALMAFVQTSSTNMKC